MLVLVGYGNIGKVYTTVWDKMNLSYAVCDPYVSVVPEGVLRIEQFNDIPTDSTVVVATPPGTHFSITKNLLRKGCRVVVEKPGIISNSEYSAALEFSPEQAYFAYHSRCNPIFTESFGSSSRKDLVSIKVIYKENVFDYHPPDSWVFDQKISGGGCLIDSGINILSILSQYTSCLTLIYRDFKKRKLHVEDFASVRLGSDRNLKLELSIDWLCQEETRLYEFRYSNGDYYSFDLATGEVIQNDKQIHMENKNKVDHFDEYMELTQHFLDYFNNCEAATPIRTQLMPIKTVLDIYNWSSYGK